MRIGLVSHCHGGFDGASIVANQWAEHLETLGHDVVEAAGAFFGNPSRQRALLPGLWADSPGAKPPPIDEAAYASFVNSIDVVIVHNVFSLAVNDAGATFLQETIGNKPTVVYHMDFPWEEESRQQNPHFPLTTPNAQHFTMTRTAQQELAARTGLASSIIRPQADVCCSAEPHSTVPTDDFTVLHPVSIYPRKRIDRAVSFVAELQEHLPARYWLTGAKAPQEIPNWQSLNRLPRVGRTNTKVAAYKQADLVVLSSDWEGYGMPIVEAAAHGRLIAAHDYPVLTEFKELGLEILPLDMTITSLSETTKHDIIRHNLAVVRQVSGDATRKLIADALESVMATA